MSMSYEQFLLLKLAEEASEIAQIALKTAQFGMLETIPGGSENNAERIHSELNDLHGIVSLLNDHTSFGYQVNDYAIEAKRLKIFKYLNYSVNLGKVDKDSVPSV